MHAVFVSLTYSRAEREREGDEEEGEGGRRREA